MPAYVYLCKTCKTEVNISERMHNSELHICPECGSIMHRRPQPVSVNWGGLKPSQGSLHPNIKNLIEDAPRRREEG
jgi:putative FmdB family regulatory protein